MANLFQETRVIGQKYTRFDSINVDNSLDRTPMIHISSEDIMIIDEDTKLQVGRNDYSIPFDASAVIALRNPVTDELTGATMTHAEVYAILYSVARSTVES